MKASADRIHASPHRIKAIRRRFSLAWRTVNPIAAGF